MNLLIRAARVVAGPKDIAPLPRADVRIEGGRIVSVTMGQATEPRRGEAIVEARGRVLMPGFVDAHTHALWVGDRISEFEMRQQGSSYEEIHSAGGGIMATVRPVREASPNDLVQALERRLITMLAEGTTTVEVKSGYGLSAGAELKMLDAIHITARSSLGTVVATALLGHAIDPSVDAFVDQVLDETLPAVHARYPKVAVDAFCETSAWSVDDCRRLFTRAIELGHPVRVHSDQFSSLGMTEVAIELGARSVDHLEATRPESLARLAQSATWGVMLPGCGFELDDRYADGRAFLDAGGKLCLATNCNPGTSPTSSMPFIIALAVRKLGLSAAEAIAATTAEPARMLGFTDRGVIAADKRADLMLLKHTDERALGYEIGGDPVDLVIAGGRVAKDRDQCLS